MKKLYTSVLLMLLSVPALSAEVPVSAKQLSLSEQLEDAKSKLTTADQKTKAYVQAKEARSKDEAKMLTDADEAMDAAETAVATVGSATKELRQSLGSCDGSGASGFNNFTAVAGSDVTLVTSEIAAAYTNILAGKNLGSRVGLRLTSSLPAEIKDQKRYVDHELQLRDGGIANLALSFLTTASTADLCQSPGRRFKVDRLYFRAKERLANNDVGMGYFFNGFGVRGIKRGDQNTELKEKTSAAGYLYVGLGLDGPLYSPLGNEGFYDTSIRYTYNRVNKDFLAPLYANDGIENVQSIAVSFKFNLTNAAAASIEYSTPVGGAKSYGMGDIALLSFTYAPEKPEPTDKSPSKTEQAGNQANTFGAPTINTEQGAATPTAAGNEPNKKAIVNNL